MAKVTGPLMSFAASGTVANALTFTKRGPATAASKAKTTQPQPTAAQAAKRLAVAHAASTWRYLAAPDKAAWSAKAMATGLPPFGYFIQQWINQGATLTTPPRLPGRNA